MIIPPELYAIIVFALQMGDVFTTRYGITKLGLGELNPLAKWLLSMSGFSGLSAFKSAVAGAFLIAVGFIVNLEYVWLMLVAISSFPIVWNTYQIRKRLATG